MGDLSYRTMIGSVGGLRRGITTGTCAAAAAKAAAEILLGRSGVNSEHQVTITLPPGRKAYSGKRISVPVAFARFENAGVTAGVRKDAGDDDDITHDALFAATVSLRNTPGIKIAGGEGVGTVTREGLKVPPGEKAINPAPQRMIRKEIEELLHLLPEGKGVNILISVPEGEQLAAKTWNPRLGITGGISIIGTSGVVEPKSSKAWKASIAAVIRTVPRSGSSRSAEKQVSPRLSGVVITPGYVGEKYLFETVKLAEERVVTVGDHVGFAARLCARRNFERIALAGHIGKIAKIAAGIFNTHSRYGDARLETVAACAAVSGADRVLVEKLLSLRLAEESVSLLKEAGLEKTFAAIARRACERLTPVAEQKTAGEKKRTGGSTEIGCAVLDLSGNLLGACPDYLGEENGWNRFLS